MAGDASARGIHYEPAPWYQSAFSDTILSIEAGATYAVADTHETVMFPLTLSTVHRGPVQFAGRWSYISMRGTTQHRFDFGDLKIYGRYRLPVFRDSTDVAPPSIWVEGFARIQVSDPQLYPFATGGQELALSLVLGWPRAAHSFLGVGRIWSEPPSGGQLHWSDVPHSTHIWMQARSSLRRFDFQLRGEVFLFEIKDKGRSVITGSITRRSVRGFHVTLDFAVETRDREERVFNQLLSLRFATRLR